MDDVDSKEISESLSKNVQLSDAYQPEVGILNSWAWFLTKSHVQIFSLGVKTLSVALRYVKRKGFTSG